jgi:hypothetical protein
MSGTYTDGTAFNFTLTDDYYLYSAVITDATAATKIGVTDGLFE